MRGFKPRPSPLSRIGAATLAEKERYSHVVTTCELHGVSHQRLTIGCPKHTTENKPTSTSSFIVLLDAGGFALLFCKNSPRTQDVHLSLDVLPAYLGSLPGWEVRRLRRRTTLSVSRAEPANTKVEGSGTAGSGPPSMRNP